MTRVNHQKLNKKTLWKEREPNVQIPDNDPGYWEKVADRKSVVGTHLIDPWVLDAVTKQNHKAWNAGLEECKRGHKYADGDWYWQKHLNGYETRVCRACKRILKAKYRHEGTSGERARLKDRESKAARERRAAKKLGIPVAEYRANLGDEIKKNPIAYLTTTLEEGRAQDRVDFAVADRGRPKCEPDPDAYYFDEEVSTQVAQKLCEGCPLIAECFDRMKYSIPIPGAGYIVAGGRVLGDGKVIPLNK